MTPELLEEVRGLLAQGYSPETVASRLGIEIEEFGPKRGAVKIPKRKQGRPSSASRCPQCGASPANQRKTDT